VNQVTGMELKAERVDQLNCGKCGQQIDPAPLKPLSTIDCPKCKHRMIVPARFGDFLLTAIVGSGAAGIVCRGLDEVLHRQVAIKVLKSTEEGGELVDACTREARALARLNSPHVVQVYNIGEYRNQHFIVMELLDGGSVEKAMTGKQNDEKAVLDIAIDAATGLGAAAKMGLVHMDVKPANILFNRQRQVKLIDFGVARFARRSSDQIIGTPYYVAPEVVRGKPADVTADIYSLGASLFHLLAGHPPFEGANVTEVIAKRLRHPAPDLLTIVPDLHPTTAQVVARMLAADPADRYPDYDTLLTDLHEARHQLDAPAEDHAIGQLVSAMFDAPSPRSISPASTPQSVAPSPVPPSSRKPTSTARPASRAAAQPTSTLQAAKLRTGKHKKPPAKSPYLLIAIFGSVVVIILVLLWWMVARTEKPIPLKSVPTRSVGLFAPPPPHSSHPYSFLV
jgi:serine/threonine protein kinase